MNLSGRGDKDVDTAGKWFGLLDDQGAVTGQKIVGAELNTEFRNAEGENK
ncbi:hypothetical protein MTP03_22880 [Tsukamurella sp. PLM1]|nr:hypothetical protein MTP03_22880 [Tsukamurella sp. PLM1]